MVHFIRSRIRSILYALAGWNHVLRNEKNAWVHAVASILVFIFGMWLRISIYEWVLILIMVTMVWLAEFLNTAIEAVVDLASPEHHPLAKLGKDVGAAAVLIAACASILVGLLILGPPLLVKIKMFIK